jgi:hypothetical protein
MLCCIADTVQTAVLQSNSTLPHRKDGYAGMQEAELLVDTRYPIRLLLLIFMVIDRYFSSLLRLHLVRTQKLCSQSFFLNKLLIVNKTIVIS